MGPCSSLRWRPQAWRCTNDQCQIRQSTCHTSDFERCHRQLCLKSRSNVLPLTELGKNTRLDHTNDTSANKLPAPQATASADKRSQQLPNGSLPPKRHLASMHKLLGSSCSSTLLIGYIPSTRPYCVTVYEPQPMFYSWHLRHQLIDTCNGTIYSLTTIPSHGAFCYVTA